MHKPVYIKIYENGDKFYYSDREMKILHREDGPAVEDAYGYKGWCLNGKRVTQEEHAKRTQKETVLTLDEIAKKFGVPVEKVRIKK
jgi:hypothetical protein